MIPTFSVSDSSIAINARPHSPNWKGKKMLFEIVLHEIKVLSRYLHGI
jgi:hypothetical protein